MLANLAWVALGGALGAALRYLLSATLQTGAAFPTATLTVNMVGSLAIGLAWGAWAAAPWFQDWGRALLVVGVLGGFTTFSAFSLEVLTLVQAERLWSAGLYVVASLMGCLAAVWLGYRLTLD